MVSLLLPVIYLAFIILGLPDSLLGSAWPVMYQELGTSGFRSRYHFHDYLCRNNCFQSEQ